jgi:hypothetical protein
MADTEEGETASRSNSATRGLHDPDDVGYSSGLLKAT